MSIRKAVLPVAGWGTRFLPATKAMPKEMLPIVDKPIIQFIVEEFIEAGIENLVFVTGRHKKAIENHFDINVSLEKHLSDSGKEELLYQIKRISHMVNPIYVRQKEQLGLGHAVLTAEPAVGKEPFVVALGDIILDRGEEHLKSMISMFNRFGKSIIALFEVEPSEVHKYGVAKVKEIEDGVFMIEDVVEKPSPGEAPSNLAIVGRYIFTPEIFEALKRTKPGKGGEIQLTDAIKLLMEREVVYAYRVNSRVYDTGNPLDYLKTVIELSINREDMSQELVEFMQELLNKRSPQIGKL